MRTTRTGNSSKSQSKQNKIKVKEQEIKTNLALAVIAGILGVGLLGYTIFKYREQLARGGVAAAKALGPFVSRVLPAIVVGVISMVVGPEGAILGVPIGAFFGPEIIAGLAEAFGPGTAGVASSIGAGLAAQRAFTPSNVAPAAG